MKADDQAYAHEHITSYKHTHTHTEQKDRFISEGAVNLYVTQVSKYRQQSLT